MPVAGEQRVARRAADGGGGRVAGRLEYGRYLEVDQPAEVTRLVAAGGELLLLLLLLMVQLIGFVGRRLDRRLRGRRQVLQRSPDLMAAGRRRGSGSGVLHRMRGLLTRVVMMVMV